MSDDDWEDDPPVHLMVGSAQASGGGEDDEPDDPLDLRWPALYVPDMTSQTGWAVHRIRDRTPAPTVRATRRAGFRMRKR